MQSGSIAAIVIGTIVATILLYVLCCGCIKGVALCWIFGGSDAFHARFGRRRGHGGEGLHGREEAGLRAEEYNAMEEGREIDISRDSIELEVRQDEVGVVPEPSALPNEAGPIANIEDVRVVEQQLEPADGGAAAWRVLFAAFMFEALLWGFPISFRVFQDYYTKLPEFKDSPHITVVGTMASGIPYLGAPFMAVLVRRYPQYRHHVTWTGWPLCILGLVAGSFVTTLGGLVVTQGIMYGTGFLIFYYPIISIVNEWWIRRRGMAFGVITSAAGASGIAMPLIISAMLQRYGHQTTLRAIAIALTLLTGPLIPLMKPRLPLSHSSTVIHTDWSFARKPLFMIYCAAKIAQGLGFFFPSLFLPSYATSIGIGARQGATLLALMSFAQVLGQWTFGILSDHVGLQPLLLLSTLVAAVATFTSWGLARDLPPLVVFALLFGFSAYGFCSLRARMGTAVSQEPTAALAMFGIFVFCQGVGNVLAGPISAALLRGTEMRRDGYAGVRYRGMVVFTGICMVGSAASVGLWYLRPRRVRG